MRSMRCSSALWVLLVSCFTCIGAQWCTVDEFIEAVASSEQAVGGGSCRFVRAASCGIEFAALSRAVLGDTVNILDLHGCGISDVGLNLLGADALSQVEELRLSGNRVSDGGCAVLSAALSRNTSRVISLDISSNNISDVGLTTLSTGVADNKVLRSLYLGNNLYGDDGIVSLVNSLVSNSVLTLLQLDKRMVTLIGLSAVGELLASRRESQRLSIIGVNARAAVRAWQSASVCKFADVFPDGSYGNATLPPRCQILHLGGCDLHDNGAIALQAIVAAEGAHVAVVDVSNNSIGDDGAAALAKIASSLAQLRLSFNRIGDSGVTSLAKAIAVSSSLEVLALDYNHVGDAGATAVFNSITPSSRLKALNLSCNRIGDAAMSSVAEFLSRNLALRTLYLADNRIGDSGMVLLGGALSLNSSMLSLLDIRTNRIGSEGLVAIAGVLQAESALQKIYVSGNLFTFSTSGLSALGEVFVATGSGSRVPDVSTRLAVEMWVQQVRCSPSHVFPNNNFKVAHLVPSGCQILNLTGHDIGDEGMTAIAHTLLEGASLRWLVLDNNEIEEVGLLSEALKVNKQLIGVWLNRNRIQDWGAELLGGGLRDNTALQDLQLAENHLSNKGVAKLLGGLKNPCALRRISLSGNGLSEHSGEVFMELLKRGCRLEEVVLDDNLLGDAGLKSLAGGIYRTPTIKHLHLRNNNLTNVGIQHFAQHVTTEWQLESLDLSKNQLGPYAGSSLAYVIGIFPALSSLYLGDTSLGDSGVSYVAEGLRYAKNLSVLVLRNNKMGVQGCIRLAHALEGTNTLNVLSMGGNPGLRGWGLAMFGKSYLVNPVLQRVVWHGVDIVGAVRLWEEGVCYFDDIFSGSAENVVSIPYGCRHLNLSNRFVGDAGAVKLGSAIRSYPHLHRILLRNCSIEAPGAVSIGRAVEVLELLEFLDLSDNQLGTKGVAAIGRALSINRKLGGLDLRVDGLGFLDRFLNGTGIAMKHYERYVGERGHGEL